MTKLKITFKPTQVTKRLIGVIDNSRAQDVLMRRHGLNASNKIETLESVGKSYGITRERVRQIENHAIGSIQKSDEYKNGSGIFNELSNFIEAIGGVTSQDELVHTITNSKKEQNYIIFLLHVGNGLSTKKEGSEFVHHWYTDEKYSKDVRNSLRALYNELSDQTVLPEDEIIEKYILHLNKYNISQKDKHILLRWLSLSKKIAKNPLEEWGRASSPSVRVKGMRDFAYLTLKRHGSPLHFSEVAKKIKELFGRDAHVATTHNELIKDSRFVLIGRGLYALSEWGYTKGVVKDVIASILKEDGPLTKNEIVERVKRERYVKDNTIIVNLQDTNIFTHLDDNTYAVVV